jgi:hypothetical protein
VFDQQQQVFIRETTCPVSFDAEIVSAAGDIIAVLAYEFDEVVPIFGDDCGGLGIVHGGEPLLNQKCWSASWPAIKRLRA